MRSTAFSDYASFSGGLRIKLPLLLLLLLFAGCDNLYRNDYRDNSPTSGKLKVYCDEGLVSHVENQAYTFMSQYPAATIEVIPAAEDRAVRALFADSCEAIVTGRLLDTGEVQMFASKRYYPRKTHVASTGVCIVAGKDISADWLSEQDVRSLLLSDGTSTLSASAVVIDRDNSSVMRYLRDTVLRGAPFGPGCSSAGSSLDLLEYVASHGRALGFIDFAWLSDRDDSLYKKYSDRLRILGVRNDSGYVAFPSQSSFKLRTYPMTRNVYVYRKTGEFSLAKGFESFVAGQRGQLLFLKQGLLPSRQAERSVTVKIGMGDE